MDVDDFLEHHGVKGQKWGIRNHDNSSNNDAHAKNKKRAIIIGSAIGAAALLAGAVYVKKHYNVSMSEASKVTNVGKSFAEDLIKEPTSIIHASRGREAGYRFLKNGGVNDPLKELVKNGIDINKPGSFVKRYGKNGEKIYAQFLDPKGRKDYAGRNILHHIVVPKHLTNGITSMDDVQTKIWPLIKDDFEKLYNLKRGG